MAHAIGSELVVLHLWELPHSDTHLQCNLQMLAPCIDLAEQQGLGLAIETIPCAVGTPIDNIERVLDRDDRAMISLDTEFLALHDQMDGAVDAGWLWESHRVRHLHIKDFDGSLTTEDGWRTYLHPGEGQIDFAPMEQRLADVGFDGFLSPEASAVRPDATVDFVRANTSMDWLRELAQRIATKSD